MPVVPGVGTGEPVAFLLTANGQKDFVTQQVQGRLLPAGWYDDHTLVWVRWHKDPESGTTVGSASVILTDLHGRVVERFPLRLGKVWTDPPDSSSVSVSPGGEILALGTDQGPDLSVWWFHLRGPSRGHVKAELAPSAYADPSGCPASWSDTIQLPGAGYPDTVLAAPGGASTIQADPRLRIGCSVWASDALRGPAYRDLTARVFDDAGAIRMGRTSWLSWHWRQVALGTPAGLPVAAAGLGRWLRRRREGRLTASQPAG